MKEALIPTLIYDDVPPGGVDAGPGGGLVGKINGGRGCCEKSKSASILPSWGIFSLTSGRGSGRPSVCGSMRCPLRKSSSINFTYASKLNI